MKLQTRLAVLVCKASGAVLRKLGRGGTNLPGKLALKIDCLLYTSPSPRDTR